MKTFPDYVRYREALTADDDQNNGMNGDNEIFEILADLMKEVWIDDPNTVLEMLKKLEAISPNKYTYRINELKKRKNSPFGRGLDKPDDNSDKPHHDIIKPEADRVGDPGEMQGDGAGGA